MTVADKTGLWKLAAVRMGMSPGIHVLDSGSPTTALELTFEQLYDQIRVAQFRDGKFDFLRRSQVLREAPTKDYLGTTHQWSDVWDYVYAQPVDSLQFLRFADEVPEAGWASNYQMISLPIAYSEVNATVAAGYVIGTTGASNNLPNYVYREWCQARFFDNDNVEHFVVDKADAAVDFGFDWMDRETEVVLPGAVAQTYEGGTAWSCDFEPGVVAGVYALTGAAGLTMELAYGSPYLDESVTTWSDHIGTNKQNASALYLIDDTTVSRWPVEAQNSIAAELAFQASITHAKSPRMIAALEKASIVAFSKAVSVLSSDDGYIEGGGQSRAARSRR